jgi:hypothetical protein
VRAAQSRRDGIGVRSNRRGGDRKGGPGRGGPRDDRGPGGSRGGRDVEFGRDERASLESLNKSKAAFSPFASFFNKAKKPEEKPAGEAGGDTSNEAGTAG